MREKTLTELKAEIKLMYDKRKKSLNIPKNPISKLSKEPARVVITTASVVDIVISNNFFSME